MYYLLWLFYRMGKIYSMVVSLHIRLDLEKEKWLIGMIFDTALQVVFSNSKKGVVHKPFAGAQNWQ